MERSNESKWIATVHVTSNLHVSTGLPCRESMGGRVASCQFPRTFSVTVARHPRQDKASARHLAPTYVVHVSCY